MTNTQASPTRIVAMKTVTNENAGNGTSWVRAATFDIQTPIFDVMNWAFDGDHTCVGGLTIQIDESAVEGQE